MTKAAQTRRARNLELGKIDAAHRCAYCRIAHPFMVFERFGVAAIYCSEHCRDAAIERDERESEASR